MSEKTVELPSTMEEAIQMIKDGYEIEDGLGFYSFIRILKKYLLEKKPHRILEWGTGLSTVLMFQLLPDTEIISIEDDPNWYIFWNRQFYGTENLHMYRLVRDGNYVEAPLTMGKFDLIFVDGVDELRAKCIEIAAQILNPRGIVVVHDSERLEYWPPINEHFRVVEDYVKTYTVPRQIESHTVVLELKNHE